jgi:hypothetical protein
MIPVSRHLGTVPSPCGRRWRRSRRMREKRGLRFNPSRPSFFQLTRDLASVAGEHAVRPYERGELAVAFSWRGRAITRIAPTVHWDVGVGNVVWQGEHGRLCPKREQPVRCCLVSKKVRLMVKTGSPLQSFAPELSALPSALRPLPPGGLS